MGEFDSEEKAGFNMAIETLKRMNQILIQLPFLRMEQDYVGLYGALDSLYLELYPFFNDKEIGEVDAKIKVLNPFIVSHKINSGITKPKVENLLKEYEKYLRNKMQKYDLLMVTKGDLGTAMLR